MTAPLDPRVRRVLALRRVRGPGVAMIFVAILMFVTSALGVYVNYISERDWSRDLWLTMQSWTENKAWQDWVQGHLDEHAQPGRDRSIEQVMMGIVIVSRVIVYSVVFLAGLRVMALRNYGLCITGTVLMLIFNGAFCAGLPVGIWALWILCQSDVRDAFDGLGSPER